MSFSRRTLLVGMAASSTLSTQLSDSLKQPDAELIALGDRFDNLAALLDRTNWADHVTMAEFDAVEKAILNQEATTIVGLSVKARAACWALLGDFDPLNQPTTDQRMAVSIVRDLIRNHAPHLERPGALAKLGAEATGGATAIQTHI